MHRTARIVWGVVPVLCLACALPAWAQKREVTVEYILSTFKPQHADVDIDTPDRKEWAQCKVELLEGKSGYLVLGPAGQVLRRFADTNGDDKTDQWGYYHNGLEVYRELDTNANNKIDQARWFNLGGTRWGVDANEDGKIDEWRQMSAEELSKLVVRALVTADTDLLTPLLVTKDDLKTLGIKGNLETRLMGSVSPIAAQWPKICKSSPVITPKTAWRRFDSRSSLANGRKPKNRNASDPINAMLNYAYGILQAQVQLRIAAEGFDPTIGIMHHGQRDAPAYAFDLMEPERPKVDAAVLRFVAKQEFSAADFTLRSDGVVRLSPQLARRVSTIGV